MRRRTSFFAAAWLSAALFIWLVSPTPASAQDRVALVIGNGAYQQAPTLINPPNDATDVAQALRGLGFDVVEGRDLDRRGVEDKIREFSRKLDRAGIALFFYAGHGLQVAGKNYLVPIDAKLERAGDLNFETVDLSLVLAQMEAEKRVNLIFLDACRDNPLLSRSLTGTRSLAVGRGLASVPSAVGTMIAYATQPDNVALDGRGRNSPFTTALLKHIATPGLEISLMMKRVRADVIEATHEQQVPWDHSSLVGDVVLAKLPEGATPPASVPSPAYVPPPIAQTPRQAGPRLSRADVTKLFGPFSDILDRVRADFVEVVDDRKLLGAAIEEMRKTAPPTQAVASAGAPPARTFGTGPTDLNGFYDAATDIFNGRATDTDDAKLVTAAIDGMLAALDPHSSYMNPTAFQDMVTQTKGEFGGLGIEIAIEKELVKIVSPIDDTPAARAGLRAGDFITHIDDASVRGIILSAIVNRLRGPVGSRVKLTVQRGDQSFDASIVRETIRVVPVKARLEGDNVAYLRITQFNEKATDALKTAIAALSKQAGARLKGYVIDLRNNPGGLLDQAISVSDAFLERGEIVATRGRKAEETQRFSAKRGDLTDGKPVAVLINGGTASASEIVSGALQDHKRATVIGTRSFGKGTVQTIIPLGTGKGALRLTTARYTTPSGRFIQANGIQPDIEVLQDVPDDLKDKSTTPGEAALKGHLPGSGGEQNGSQSYVPPEPRDDKALQRALELVRTAKR